MKTLEDLNLLPTAALQEIYLELTGNKPKSSLNKAQLVQAVYEVQQPDADVKDATGDESNDEETEKSLSDADALSVEEEEDDLIGDAPGGDLGPDLPAKREFTRSDKDANVEEIAKALAHLPIQVVVDDVTVTLTKGSKEICTTVKQPLYRIVATAETFAR